MTLAARDGLSCHTQVVDDLVVQNPVHLGEWSKLFRPVQHLLLPRLADIFRDQRPERIAERNLATNLLSDYAADQPAILAELLLDADEKQFAVIFSALKGRGDQGMQVLLAEMDKKLPDNLALSDEAQKIGPATGKCGCGPAPSEAPERVWPLLRHSPDPRVRSYLIHLLRPLGAHPKDIIGRFDNEPDLTIRRALLLAIGEFDEHELPLSSRQMLLSKVQALYGTESDPGIHAAAEWLLRQWQQDSWLKKQNDEWSNDKEQRQKRLENIKLVLKRDKEKSPAVVCERPRAVDGGHRRAAGFSDGVATDRSREAGLRGPAQNADQTILCGRCEVGHLGAIPSV